jgi:CcmD family protein
MRTACEEELAKDADWFDNLKARLSEKLNRDVHEEAFTYAKANNKHVVAAYAAFWLLTVGFVIMMWRRQRALQAELTRLERDLAKAVKDGGAA